MLDETGQWILHASVHPTSNRGWGGGGDNPYGSDKTGSLTVLPTL